PTPHTSPLSLHDALPISIRAQLCCVRIQFNHWRHCCRGSGFTTSFLTGGSGRSRGTACKDCHECYKQKYFPPRLFHNSLLFLCRDRKSTRLNSSHVKISY